MSARSTHRHIAPAISCILLLSASPALSQDVEDDPFLSAMLNAQKASQTNNKPTTPPVVSTPSEKTDSSNRTQDKVDFSDSHLIDTKHDTKLVDDATMARELGASTGLGLLNQLQNYDGKTVKSVNIRYVSGKRTVPDQRLLDIIQTAPGSKYSSARINADLTRLIEKGLVGGNARVTVSPGSGGVNVTFEVEAANVMGGVGFTGNASIDADTLREATKLVSGKAINDRDLSMARAAIIALYQDEGFPDVKVSWRHADTARRDYNDIIFDIKEGRQIRMMSISFVGNKQFDNEQLRHVMKTQQRSLLYFLDGSGVLKRDQLDEDMQEIIRLYRNYGYLRASISKIEYTETKKRAANRPQKLAMRVYINEGPRYRVRHVSFTGNTVYTAKQLEPGMSMLDGDIYSLQKVSDDVLMIRNYYGAKGYADADARPDIKEVGVDKNGVHIIDICYRVNEGKRYAVGRIKVRGNTKTRQHVILRELPLKPGQNLNAVDLETAKKRLMGMGYFAGVDVSQSASDVPGYRDINVNVLETMTGNLTFGVAVSSVENVYLFANVTQSNFDIRGLFGRGSIVGGGQRLAISGKLGWDYQSASLSLLEPWFLDRKLALGNEIYFSNSSYMSDYYTQKNYGYAVSLRKAIGEKNAVKLEYRIEHYTITPQGMAPYYFLFSSGDYDRSNLRLSFERDTRDAINTPRKGGNIELYASYSGPGSSIETYSMGLSGSIYYNSFWDSIFSLRFGLDTVDTVDKNEMVPIYERCYLGGPYNLRGFRYHDVGIINPILTGDETMGGNSSAYMQAEMSLPIAETIRFAFFFDAGFVHEDPFDFSLKQFTSDVGIGLRINLPMGPLAVDYAIPLRVGNAVDRSGQFQFYVDYKY